MADLRKYCLLLLVELIKSDLGKEKKSDLGRNNIGLLLL